MACKGKQILIVAAALAFMRPTEEGTMTQQLFDSHELLMSEPGAGFLGRSVQLGLRRGLRLRFQNRIPWVGGTFRRIAMCRMRSICRTVALKFNVAHPTFCSSRARSLRHFAKKVPGCVRRLSQTQE